MIFLVVSTAFPRSFTPKQAEAENGLGQGTRPALPIELSRSQAGEIQAYEAKLKGLDINK
jgi:hypothetical protein